MANKFDVYKCDVCGTIIEVFHAGAGPLACCNQPMRHLKEGSVDAALEKHVPVVEKTLDGYKISVGSTLHPMTEEHYIEWIEVFNGNRQRVFHLNPGDEPVVEVKCGCNVEDLVVREYCNLHGLWKNNK